MMMTLMTVTMMMYTGEQAGNMLLIVTANDIDIQPMLTYDLVTPGDLLTSVDLFAAAAADDDDECVGSSESCTSCGC